jgi:hypothetical protein
MASALGCAERRVAACACAQVESLQRQLEAATSSCGALGAEVGALREELGAMGEDLEALVRENQVCRRAEGGVLGPR